MCVGLLLAFAFSIACASTSLQGPPDHKTFTYPTWVELSDGTYLSAEAGRIFVPTSRLEPNGDEIAVSYLRFKSTSKNPSTPIFWLAGGPGSSWLDRIAGPQAKANREKNKRFDWSVYQTYIEEFTSVSDLVLIDQRGTGLSLPFVNCPTTAQIETRISVFSAQEYNQAYAAFGRDCKRALEASGLNLGGFQIFELVEDVDDLRSALGYEKISIFGGSFGSQWTFSILKQNPSIVERVLLWGIEDLQDTYDDPEGILDALKSVIDARYGEHAADAKLEQLQEVIAQLEASPVRVEFEPDEPGVQERSAWVTADLVRRQWRRGTTSRSAVTAWYDRFEGILAREFETLASEAFDLTKSLGYDSDYANGMSLAIDCGLLPPKERQIRFSNSPAVSLLGNLNAEYDAICPAWNAAQPAPSFMKPATSLVPALLIHGTWDMSTPISNAEAAVEQFQNGKLIRVPYGSHSVVDDLMRERADIILPIIRDFFGGGSVDAYPDTIELPPSP